MSREKVNTNLILVCMLFLSREFMFCYFYQNSVSARDILAYIASRLTYEITLGLELTEIMDKV